MLQRLKSSTQLLFAKFSYSVVDAVDKILEEVSDSTERDKVLRKLLAKHAPCPVEGSSWSLVNSLDYNFVGFKGKHLKKYIKTHTLLDTAHISHTPSLVVVRDLGLAAKLAYEDPNVIRYICQTWKMETAPHLYFSFKDTQAYIMYDEDNIVLSFRGTELLNPKDWSTDFKVKFVPMYANASNGAGGIDDDGPDEASSLKPKTHKGFLESLGLHFLYDQCVQKAQQSNDESLYLKIYEVLNQMLYKDPHKKIWVAGHSMGGALASLFVAQLLLNDDELLQNFAGLYTYGQPRCGNGDYCKLFHDLVKQGLVYRVVNKTDVIPKVPMEIMNYSHHGCKVKISSKELEMEYKGKDVKIHRTSTPSALPKNSSLKKISFALMPDLLEDHYPCEYVRNVQRFI